MAITTQELNVGGIPSARLAYAATFTAGKPTEIATFKRFDATVADTGEDFVAVASITPALGDAPDKEYADYELRNKDVIRQERTTTYYKASTGDTLANADNPDTIEMVFAFSTAQKIKLQDLKKNQTPVILSYPEMNAVSSGAPDAYTHILGTIKSLSEAGDTMGEYTMSIEGTIEYTFATTLDFTAVNTAMAYSTAPFVGFGEDSDGGDTCIGFTAPYLTSLGSGELVTIPQA